MKYRQKNKSWEDMITASRNEKIPQLDVRRKIREQIATEGMPAPENLLELMGSLFTIKPLKYAAIAILLISVSGYAAITSKTQDTNSNLDPVASFLIDSNYSVNNES